MTTEEKSTRFGYNPDDRLRFIGQATVLHKEIEGKFDFYYNTSTKVIDVCYSGCNGTYRSGEELSDTETTLSPEFSKAFFEVKNRVPQGYSFIDKPWIGRIVITMQETPPGYINGALHFDVYHDVGSGSIDLHSVGICSPMFRAILRPDGSTTLPLEFQNICRNLCLNPQLSLDEHNTSCEECLASLRRYQ